MLYLHSQGRIHGDLKADNVLITDDLHAVLCDFGLARLASETTAESLQGAGNSRWQSPELWEDGASRSEKTDIWAFGMTAYEVHKRHLPELRN